MSISSVCRYFIFVLTLIMPGKLIADISLSSQPRVVTAKDIVEQAQFYPVATNSKDEILISPDGRNAIFIVGKGDIQSGVYKFNLIKFDMQEIDLYLSKSESALKPKASTIASFEYDQSYHLTGRYDSAGIKHVRFGKNSNYITFIANDRSVVSQIYSINLDDMEIKKITNSKYPIIDYIETPDGKGFIYYTRHLSKQDDCRKTSFLVGIRMASEAMCLKDGSSFYDDTIGLFPGPKTADLYRIDIVSNKVYSLYSGLHIPYDQPLEEWIVSPASEYAIFQLTALEPFPSWEEVEKLTPTNLRLDYVPEFERKNISDFTRPLYRYGIYGIINLKSGELTEIINYPIIPFGNDGGEDRFRPVWVDGSKVNLGKLLVVDREKNIVAISSSSLFEGKSLIFDVEKKLLNEEKYVIDYEKNVNFASSHYNRIDIKISSSWSSRPVIVARDNRSGNSKVIFDPNPHFDQLKFGKVEEISWNGRDGEIWKGVLIYPVNFRENKRYPIVVQTNGDNVEHFLMGGPSYGTAPYAAQALSGQDIFVLQIPNEQGRDLRGAYYRIAYGIKEIISILRDKKYIDEQRIGLTGYSYTGTLVLSMLVFPDFPAKAAVISDAFSISPVGYSESFGLPQAYGPLFRELILCGARPWGGKLAEWVMRNPAFHLDNIRTPIMLEQYNGNHSQWWDIYTLLLRLRKPVEFRIYPAGNHPPLRIDIVHSSMQNVVEWFDFWLNGKKSEIIDEKSTRWQSMKYKMEIENGLYKRDFKPLSEQRCINN